MQLLKNLKAPTTNQLLSIWRRERSLRVGKALSYSALFLSLVTFSTDVFFGSDRIVVVADIFLFLGCAVSVYWVRGPRVPLHYWMPLFIAFWVSCWPFFWSTGGLDSPFFGVCLAALYVLGTILDSENRS